MIPLALVTGFLGSGKTTFLGRVAARNPRGRLFYLVNEFSQSDVDSQLLETDDDVLPVAGGSIFCRCLVTEFIYHLKQIAARGTAGDDGVSGLVVEASGIADPRVVEAMLAETKLDQEFALSTIVAIVDPWSFLQLVESLPNISAQIEAADVVLINKIDLHDEQMLAKTEAAILELNPRANILRTQNAECEVELFGAHTPRGLQGEYALCSDPNYVSSAIEFSKAVDVERLVEQLRNLGADLYRAKGFVPTTAGVVYVDLSLAGHAISPPRKHAGACELVLIGRGGAGERFSQTVETIRAWTDASD